jgi:hypothetical protein
MDCTSASTVALRDAQDLAIALMQALKNLPKFILPLRGSGNL